MKAQDFLAVEVSGDKVLSLHAKGYFGGYALSLQLLGASCPASQIGDALIYVHPRAGVEIEVIAVAVYGIQPGKGGLSIHRCFLLPIFIEPGLTPRMELEKGFTPRIGRNFGLEPSSIVAKVGGLALNTHKLSARSPQIYFPDAQAIVRWAIGEVSDEQLLELVGEVQAEQSAVERLKQLEPQLRLVEAKTGELEQSLTATTAQRDQALRERDAFMRATEAFVEFTIPPWWRYFRRRQWMMEAFCDRQRAYDILGGIKPSMD